MDTGKITRVKSNLIKEKVMKYHKIINICLFSVFVLAGFLMTACDDDINVGKENEDKYLPANTGMYLVDQNGKKDIGLVEFRETNNTKLTLKLNQAVSGDTKAFIKYDQLVLDQYNQYYDTHYELFPSSLLTLGNNGVVEIKGGDKISHEIELSLKSDGTLDSEKSYVIPLKITAETSEISEKESSYLIFVKDMTGIPSAEKYVVGSDGVSRKVEIISCMEINDTNPLNNAAFTLKESGKPLIDIVILFSANINYNPETGRVYVFQNPQVTAILGNREKYLKPLQDKGIKVVLGIMPNHDRASITNLAEETAQAFAQELKAYMEAYKLDGVFWDDEYSSMISPPPPGFVSSSNQATSYLIHEFNKVMPDKLNMVYVYSGTSRLSTVDGKRGGEYITHGIHDYGGGSGLSGNYPGLPESGWGMYSQEFARGYYTSTSNLRNVKDNGYCHMIFAMDPFRNNYSRQRMQMQDIARTIFSDELVEGQFYKKDY